MKDDNSSLNSSRYCRSAVFILEQHRSKAPSTQWKHNSVVYWHMYLCISCLHVTCLSWLSCSTCHMHVTWPLDKSHACVHDLPYMSHDLPTCHMHVTWSPLHVTWPPNWLALLYCRSSSNVIAQRSSFQAPPSFYSAVHRIIISYRVSTAVIKIMVGC